MKKSIFLGLIIASAVAISAYAARQSSTQQPETPVEVAENAVPLVNIDEDVEALCRSAVDACTVKCNYCGYIPQAIEGTTIGVVGTCPVCYNHDFKYL